MLALRAATSYKLQATSIISRIRRKGLTSDCSLLLLLLALLKLIK